MGDEVVSSDREQVHITEHVRADLMEFRDAIGQTRTHEHDAGDVCDACIIHLGRAVAAYRGDFMGGFSIRDAPEFEDWTRTTAESLRLEVGRAYERLATGLASQGDYRSAIEAVNSWLELDSLREPAYRQLMILCAWAGDGAGATEAYRRCVAALSRELGVDPLEETTELHEAILDDDLPPAPSLRKRVVARRSDDTYSAGDLIDRTKELGVLFRAVEEPESGKVIWVVGEAWLGKTRLLDELQLHAGRRAASIASARGYQAERDLPYGVVSQLLASLSAAHNWANIKANTPQWVLNEAGRLNPDLGKSEVQNDGLGETRLYDAVFRLITTGQNLVIVDDLQWADQSSLALLTYVLHRIGETSTLLVLAHRRDESTSLAPIIEASQSGRDQKLVLEPLVPADIAELAQNPEDLIARTGGIPALVTEALSSDEDAFSHGIRRFMDSRLAGLGGLSQQVLTTAAVLNGTCDFDLIRATSGRSEDEVVEAIETLIRRGVLQTTSDDRLEFAFANMESLVYDEISRVRRSLLHRRAASAIEQLPNAGSDGVIATTIAQHHREGGQIESAAEWFVMAGDLAGRVFASAEAINSYRAALALGGVDEARLHRAIGDSLLFLGRFSEARAEFQQAAALSDGPDRALAEHRIGEANRRLGRFDVAVAQFQLAQVDHPDHVTLFCDWALALLRLGDRTGAKEKAEHAAASAENGPTANRSRALTVLAIVSDDQGQSRSVLEEALELAEDDPALRMAALNALAYTYAQSDEGERAVASVNEALAIAAEIGDRHRQAALWNHLADLHHRSGRKTEAERSLTEAVKLFAEVEPGSWEPEVWLLSKW